MSDTTNTLPPPVADPKPDAVPPKEQPKAEAAPAGVETFDNPQFRPGEFTPFTPPSTDQLSAASPDTLKPSVVATAPMAVAVAPTRATESTASIPPPQAPEAAKPPSAAPVTAKEAQRAQQPTANMSPPMPTGRPPAPAAFPVAPRPPAAPAPTPALPVATIASVGIVAFGLGCLTGWLLHGPSAAAATPPPVAAAAAPAPTPVAPAVEAPRLAPPPPAEAAAAPADDIKVPEPAHEGHHEHASAEHAASEHASAEHEHDHHHPAATSPAPAPTPTAAPAAVAAPSPASGGPLKVYETATLAEAAQAAKKANDAVLAAKIASLITARQKAEEARRDKDLGKEAASLDDAYHIDFSIDRGGGPYHHQLQLDAVRLHLQVGDQQVSQHQLDLARAQYAAALSIEPSSADAKKKLADLGQKH